MFKEIGPGGIWWLLNLLQLPNCRSYIFVHGVFWARVVGRCEVLRECRQSYNEVADQARERKLVDGVTEVQVAIMFLPDI